MKSGSYVSVDALIDLTLWNIDTYIMTKRNRVVAVLKNLEDDSHVKTRISQYQAINNEKGNYIAKQIVKSKIEGQNRVLKKYGLKLIDFKVEDVENRRKLLAIESRVARLYFSQIFKLFPEKIRPKKRIGYKAYDGINNVFNFGYYVLKCRIHKALLKAKLEPYLGFLHSTQFGKPSLVCDFQELYRYLIDDFIIQHYMMLRKSDLVLKEETVSPSRKGKREYLKKQKNNDFIKKLNKHFTSIVEVPRVKIGDRQEIETLINEEAFLFAKYLRNERINWIPRIPTV